MLIHFVHIGDAYLPELPAYVAFVEGSGHQARVHHQINTVPGDASVVWWLCGQVSRAMAQHFPAAFQIHEYASASVPPLAWLKDRAKHYKQALPHYRIYQNDWVRQRLGFADALPFEYRDMGVAPDFFGKPLAPPMPEFDFVYLGEMRRLRYFKALFEALAQLDRRVLLVGEVPPDLKLRLQRHANVSFADRVAHSQVPAQLRRARYGLNLVPDQLPYSRQTSTKLLEYCAVGLPVVSSDYAWVRQFEGQYAARFAYLRCNASSGTYHALLGAALDRQALAVPDVSSLAWPRLLAGLRVWRQIGLMP